LRVGYTRLGVGGNQWPVAVAHSNVTGGDTPLDVAFNSTGSSDPDGTLAAYGWDFGDGSTSVSANPGHTYTTPGNYVVTLVVTDTEGAATTQTLGLAVTAPNQLPLTVASATPLSGNPPLDVTFSARGSYDPDGRLGNFHWVFGDGTDSWGPTAYQTFYSPGIYHVTLTAYDDRGGTGTDTVTIYVGQPNQAPVAVASATPPSGNTPLDVSFSSASSYDPDGTLASYAWDFGDGGTSTQANPTHTYTTYGSYQVVLTVTDNLGLSNSDSLAITANGVSLPTNQSAEGAPGESVTYTLMVNYIGSEPSATFDIGMVITGAQWTVEAPTSIGPIPSGGNAPLTIVVHVPTQAVPGEQSVTAVTLTSQGNPGMYATTQLTTSIPVPVASGVELFTAESEGRGWPGDSVIFTLTLTNTGSLTQTFTLSAETVWDVYLQVTEVVLAPGASETILVHVNIPAAANAGDVDSATIVATSTIGSSVSANVVLTTRVDYRVFSPIIFAGVLPPH
jgi:PKD repeat protein